MPHHRKHRKHESGTDATAAVVDQAAKFKSPKSHDTTDKASPDVPASSFGASPPSHDVRSGTTSTQQSGSNKKAKGASKTRNRATAFLRRGFRGIGRFGGQRDKRLDFEQEIELPGVKGMPVSFLVFLLIVGFVVVGFVVVAAIKLIGVAVLPKKPEAYNCTTGACIVYGHFLIEGVRDDVHPCDDFYKHVCGKWDVNRVGISFLDYVRDRFYRAVVQAARAMEIPRVGQTPAHKAAQFFRSCDDILDQDQSGEAMTALNKGGITWPHEDAAEPDVLAAIFHASINLFLPAVVHVSLIVEGAGQTRLHLRRADSFDALAEKQARLMALGQFDRYFALLRANFVSQNRSSMSIEDTARWERTITPELRRYVSNAETIGVSVTMEQLESAARGSTRLTWRDAIGRHLENASSNENVVVMIFGKAFLDTFLNLTRVHGERAMHRYVSWYAVQDIAKYANLELAINYYGSEDLARRVHSIHCARLTDMLVGVSFALPQLRMSLPADAARTVSSMAQIVALVTDDHLNSRQKGTLGSLTAELPDASSHADERSGDNATAELPAFRSSEDALKNISDMSKAFLPNWILANKVRQNDAVEDTALGVEVNFTMPALENSRFYGKTVSLRPWFVFPPVFTPDLPPGFLYGGLGGELVSALIALDANHRESESWMQQGGNGPTSMPAKERYDSATLLFVVDVLVSALGYALSKNASIIEDYKRIFVQWCYMRCGSPRDADLCNGPFKGTTVFSRVFACPVDRNVTFTTTAE